jgi:hypothetical protein
LFEDHTPDLTAAVGEQFWPKYFSQLRDRLLPAASPASTPSPSRTVCSRPIAAKSISSSVTFWMLPSPQVLKSLGERFGVPVIRERIFGQDYAKTLAIWRSNFREAWPNLMPSGFDDRFRRLWEYYLAYCEAGFLKHRRPPSGVREAQLAALRQDAKPASTLAGRALVSLPDLAAALARFRANEKQQRRRRSDRQYSAN